MEKAWSRELSFSGWPGGRENKVGTQDRYNLHKLAYSDALPLARPHLPNVTYSYEPGTVQPTWSHMLNTLAHDGLFLFNNNSQDVSYIPQQERRRKINVTHSDGRSQLRQRFGP